MTDVFSYDELKRNARALELRLDGLLAFSAEDDNELVHAQLKEAEELVRQLSEINSMMSSASNGGMTVNRGHRDRLRYYTQTIQRMRQNLEAKRARDSLLSGVRRDVPTSDVSVSMNMLMEDSKSLDTSNQDARTLLEQGDQITKTIARGRQILEKASNRVRNTIYRFGQAESAMTTISRAKIKNSVILGVVIGLCICFLLWWWLSKF